jgi:mevalonate kinase
MTQGKASAPAKVILFGEHFVVYGNPAILASINKRIFVEARTTTMDNNENDITIKSDIGVAGRYYDGGKFKMLGGGMEAKAVLDPLYNAIKQVLAIRNKNIGIEIDISSQVPPRIGLGSSAASCVATIAAVDSLFNRDPSKQNICKLAVEAERWVHKTTSGADCYVSTFGGLIKYQSRSKAFKKLETIGPPICLVVASTGVNHYTADLVAMVKRFRDRNHMLFGRLARRANDICLQASSTLRSGNYEKTGKLMDENQNILRQIGVSHNKAEDLIEICSNAGALGAKVTGAGGGGSIIALAGSKKESAKIASRIRRAGYESFKVEIDNMGLDI